MIILFCISRQCQTYQNSFEAMWYLNSCPEIGFSFLVLLSFSELSRVGDSQKNHHLHYVPRGAVTVTYTHLSPYTRQYVMYCTCTVKERKSTNFSTKYWIKLVLSFSSCGNHEKFMMNILDIQTFSCFEKEVHWRVLMEILLLRGTTRSKVRTKEISRIPFYIGLSIEDKEDHQMWYFKLRKSPGIDSKESIPPAFVARLVDTTTTFLLTS